MSDNESVKFFLRFVQEKHEEMKQRLNTLFQALASDKHDEKVEANSAFLEACEDLSRTLSAPDQPDWLARLIDAAKTYSANHKAEGHNFRLLNQLVANKAHALSHTWSFEKGATEANYKFDELYERFKKDSKLSELFDSLVATLEKMIASGEIDSVSALNSLEQLIAIIKQNKSGSYFSVMASWEFISSFMKNLVWQELASLPGIKQLKSAFEKTAQEMDIELESMHGAMAEEMKKKYQTTVRSLTYRRKGENLLEHKADEE